MATYGFNFRETVGYVTDGSRQVFVDGTDDYPKSYDFGGGDTITAGWVNRSGGYPQERDRNAGAADPRLAGLHYTDNGSGALVRDFRIDVPGSNKIDLACGDQSYALPDGYIAIRDSAGEKFNINHASGFTSAGSHFRDARDTEHASEAAWVSDHALSDAYTFTDYVLLRIGSASGSVTSEVNHIAVVQQGSTTKPAYAYAQQQ